MTLLDQVAMKALISPPCLELITCLVALAHHNHMQLNIYSIKLADVDLSTVPTPHLLSLISRLPTSLGIENVTGCDLVALLNSVQCKILIIKRQYLGKEETQALLKAMETRVEMVRLFDVELDMEALPEYSGQGRCTVLDYHTKEIATDIKYVEKMKTWAEEKTWIHRLYDDDHGPKSYCFRQTAAWFFFENLLEQIIV